MAKKQLFFVAVSLMLSDSYVLHPLPTLNPVLSQA